MIAVYGNYRHKINTTGVTIASDVEETEAGVPFRVNLLGTLEGRLRNPEPGNPKALDPIIAEMQNAYSVMGQDFGLLHDDGRRTAAFWRNQDTIGGIRTKFLSYPNYQGGEYCSYRKFQIQVQFQMPLGNLLYMRFTEALSIEGGGPTFDVKEVNFGVGTRQRTRTHQKCTAVQSGSAVGRGFFPPVPDPIWPFALRTPEPKTNKVIRPRGGRSPGIVTREECEISWSYDYVWPIRLEGVPHFAIG